MLDPDAALLFNVGALLPLQSLAQTLPPTPENHETLYARTFNLKLPGNEIYYTFSKILLEKIMLCSKLDCQKLLN